MLVAIYVKYLWQQPNYYDNYVEHTVEYPSKQMFLEFTHYLDFCYSKGWALVLFTTLGTYVELHYIEHFSTNQCQNLEGMVQTIYIIIVLYNTLKGLPSVTCGGVMFLREIPHFFEQQYP